jgi:hypothetical protein
MITRDWWHGFIYGFFVGGTLIAAMWIIIGTGLSE